MQRARSGSPTASAASRPANRRTSASGASDRSPNSATWSGCRGPSGASSRAMMPRLAAALVAIVCWAGLAVQFSATYGNQHDLLASLWVLARFFTIITNLLLAVTMTWAATGGRVPAIVAGGLALAILLVGVIYATLLQNLYHLVG